MKRKIVDNWTTILSVLVLILPFIALTVAWILFHINIFDNPDFWYGYMGYFGTVILAGVAVRQTQKVSILSQKFDEINAIQNYSLAKSTQQCRLFIAHQDNRIVSWSAHHKRDAGAIILLERIDNQDVPLNEYLLELYFQDYSKAAIKSFELLVNQMVCVQEADSNGMTWGDGSDAPIPIGFTASPVGSHACPIWVGVDTFKIMLKIYAPNNGIFTQMIENPVSTCLMIQAKILSVCGVETKMRYKYWFKKENGEFCIDACESTMLDINLKSIAT